jgi:hypothetical protein
MTQGLVGSDRGQGKALKELTAHLTYILSKIWPWGGEWAREAGRENS